MKLMQPTKPIKTLSLGIIIHAVILLAALGLGYDSYRKYMTGIEPLGRDVKNAIKATFPWAVLTFSGLYFIFAIRKKADTIFLSYREYIYIIITCTALVNLFFFSKGGHILIPLNLSINYFVVLMLCAIGLSRLAIIGNIEYLPEAQDYLPPVVYRFLMRNLPVAHAYAKERPSARFIIAFMLLLLICVFFLIFKAEKAAEQLANVAYFLLVIGVGIEAYQLIKSGKMDKKE